MLAATIKRLLPSLIVLAGFVWAPLALAQEPSGIPGIPAFTVTPGEGEGAQEYSVTLQILALMTALTFLPAMLMMMTSFTRIIVVFAILRQAIGLQSTPSNQILLGLALFLSIFIMKPVLEEANRVADFMELSELLVRDALEREESCGAHFREEHQTEDGEARRDDENFSYAAAWEFQGVGTPHNLHKEELSFEHCKPTRRSYK